MSRDADRMKENMSRVLRYAFDHRIVSRREVFFWLKVYSFFYFQTAWMYGDQCRRARAVRDLLLSALLWPWFLQPSAFNEPPLFRIRSLIWFIRTKHRVSEVAGTAAAPLAASAFKRQTM